MATVGTTFRPKPLSLVIRGEKGRGSYGTVCRGELEGKPIMIKRIHEILLANSRSDQLRKFEQECQILETLHHPNIVRSLGAFWDDATKEPLLLMEPMRENLRDYLDGKKQAGDELSVDDHLSISLSIAEGLKFLHEQKQPIAHRDLTDKNILLGEDESIKIGDFGQSALLAGSTDYMGTLAPGAFVFMPPEALMDEPHYNLKVDSFSMGVLMLEISTQTHPPARMSKIGSSQEVERRSKDLILLDSCHPLKPLIIWCLQNQYQLRPGVSTIHSQLMTLKHPELQRKVDELQTGLRLAESHSLQLEEALQKSDKESQVLKSDKMNLQDELEKTKDKLSERELTVEVLSRSVEQYKNENERLKRQLTSTNAREVQLILQLRQTEHALADKQTLQEELERQLSEKDKEIAILTSENEATARYARDSLRRLQDVPKFLDDIKAVVTSVSSAVEKIEESCAERDKQDKKDGGSVPDDSLAIAVDTFPSMNPLTVQLMQRLKLFDATYIRCSEDFTTVSVVGEGELATRAGDVFINKYQDLILGTKKIITETAFTHQLTEEQYALLLSEIEDQHPEVLCHAQFTQQSMVLSALEQSKLLKAKQHIASFSPGMQLPAVPPRPSHTTPQDTSPRDTTLPLPNGGVLTVKRGDLLKEKVTAIVNAANERLDHIGGVAFAIDRASGGNVQRESRKIIQKSGRVPTGQVAVTGAGGRLQCQSVIHAVGPDANVRPHKECEQLLKLVCENVLRTAEAQGMVSIALPAISSGIYAMKKDVVAQILISTILHYPYQHSSSVKDIRIVLFEEETLKPFLLFASEAKKDMPPGTAQHVVPVSRAPDVVEIPLVRTHRKMVIKKAHLHGVGASTTGAVDTRSIPSVSIPFQQGRNLTIKKGDLVEEAVVAIVNSTDEHLQHSSGVARAINEASGGAVQVALNEVVARMGGSTQSGRVVVTAAGGKLRCKHVIHVVWPAARDRPNKGYEKLLEELCQQVLCTAEEKQVQSIALPHIISGFCNLSQEVVAQVLIDSVLHYPYIVNCPIKDIHIVISDDETLTPFLKYAKDIKKTNSTASVGSAASKRNAPSQPHITNEGSHEGQPGALSGPTATPAPADNVVEIPLENTHRKMVIKKTHFIYEDVDIKVIAICSELGFETGVNKDLDGHLKGQLSEAVRGRYQHRRPDKFDVFTVHVQHATISCRYLVIANILERSLGSRHDGHKYLQQIFQAVCQEADTLEMPSVAIAPNTFTVGGFQKESILPEFIRVISHFRFTNDDFLTDVRFLAVNQDGFDSLVADAERTVGKILRSLPQPAKLASQTPFGSSYPRPSPSPQPPIPVVGSVPDHPPASNTDLSKDTQLPSPGPGMTKLSKHVFFAFACGDLCKVQADAVVVPVAPSLALKSGVVQAVDAASSGAINRVVKHIQQTKQKVSEGTAVPVEILGGLPCKHIILLIRNAKAKSEALDHACYEALKLAEGLGAHSVTFPPISSNKGKDKLAKCMTGAFASFLPQNRQYIVGVTVVIRENDEATLQAFRSLVGVDTTDQGRDELAQQLKTDTDAFTTPPDSPSPSHLGSPCLEDDPSAKVDEGTAV